MREIIGNTPAGSGQGDKAFDWSTKSNSNFKEIYEEKFGIKFIDIDIYTAGGDVNGIKEKLIYALNNYSTTIEIIGNTIFTCKYTIGYSIYTAKYAFALGFGGIGAQGQNVSSSDLLFMGTEKQIDYPDPDDLNEATDIATSINSSSEVFDTSVVNIFRRTIGGSVKVYAYTPSGNYQNFIGNNQTDVVEADFTDITNNASDEVGGGSPIPDLWQLIHGLFYRVEKHFDNGDESILQVNDTASNVWFNETTLYKLCMYTGGDPEDIINWSPIEVLEEIEII